MLKVYTTRTVRESSKSKQPIAMNITVNPNVLLIVLTLIILITYKLSRRGLMKKMWINHQFGDTVYMISWIGAANQSRTDLRHRQVFNTFLKLAKFATAEFNIEAFNESMEPFGYTNIKIKERPKTT